MARDRRPIYRTAAGTYEVRTRDSNGKQLKPRFARRADAEAFFDSTRTAVRAGTYVAPDAGRERFSKFARSWAEGRDWTESTREAFGVHLRRLDGMIGDQRLDQIDELDLERLRTALTKRYATSTAGITLHYACAVMRSAYRTGRIARDPTSSITAPKRRDGSEDGVVTPKQVPTRDEVVTIIAAAPARYRAAVALGACGLRVGEVLGATVDRIDLEAGTLLVDRQLQRVGSTFTMPPPKREKKRQISLPGFARIEVRRHLRDHGPFWPMPATPDDSGLLFRGGRDGLLTRSEFYAQAWRPALVGAGLASDAYVFHSLRHFCASSLLAEGAPLTAVAGHLGDTVETVSRTYLHWLRDDRDIPATILDRVLAPRPNAHEASQ